ncbi:hypothetical protein [Bradyrhizobium sp. PRIMUS42]|uniref:Nmad2 family putative nucleotide modification protein n=1 Tax=Bradyrhizobium sp. PRIMUS42 TaxID=2908926 RepID=UPI001FF1E02B|nr:hypothetical protein [Bradyrhizobium sp. PRIMUS42]MCJ9728980.1 hypothetical protein [Bradyrhizobium sp. PRIMUS42]
MTIIERIYFYKLTVDAGAAPCVERGMLSLAICKPMMRSSAEVDDLIFGFTASSIDPRNRLIYAARITKKLTDGEYYEGDTFSSRQDCILGYDPATMLGVLAQSFMTSHPI